MTDASPSPARSFWPIKILIPMRDGSAWPALVAPASDAELADMTATDAEAAAMQAIVDAGGLKGVLRPWTLVAIRPVNGPPRINAFGRWQERSRAVAPSDVLAIRPEALDGPPRLARTVSGSVYLLAEADRDDPTRPDAAIRSHVLRTLRHWGAVVVDDPQAVATAAEGDRAGRRSRAARTASKSRHENPEDNRVEPICEIGLSAGRLDETATFAGMVGRAADLLGLDDAALGRILRVPEEDASRLRGGGQASKPGRASAGMGLLLVTLQCGLEAYFGGDQASARSWLRRGDLSLDGVPLELIQREDRIVDVVAYVWARCWAI